METIDIVKLLLSYLVVFVTTLWGAYRIWFKANTNDFVTKAEMKKLEVEVRKDIVDVKAALTKMEGDLKLHIELTKQHNAHTQDYLKRLEEQQKDLKGMFEKNFEHLTNNIRNWNQSTMTHNLLSEMAKKLDVKLD